MRWIPALLVGCAATLAAADTPKPVKAAKPPSWTKIPTDKYRCSRYAPGIGPTDKLRVFAPPGKPMIFTMAARAPDRSKVTYHADALPPGATVDAKGKFSWTIPKDETGSWDITLYAESAGGSVSYAFTLAIAEPDLVLAWHTGGMGSYEPDCAHRIMDYGFSDLDGDGQRDLVYVEGDEKDDSASSGSYVQHVERRVGAKFDGIDRKIANGSIKIVTLPDGKPAVSVESSCCCSDTVDIYRITPTGVDSLLSASGQDCSDYRAIDYELDNQRRIHRVITRFRDGPPSDPPSERAYRWTKGAFEPE